MTFTAIKQVFAEAEGEINAPVLRWQWHHDGKHSVWPWMRWAR